MWGGLRRRRLPPGESFVWYVAAYAVFRFLVEFVRGNDVAWAGLTRPQLFLLATIPLLLARIIWQVRQGAYRGAMVPTSSTDVGRGVRG
jgi:phosphatidylglycerol:prolipoprotein diacylglycerol transferase